MREPPWARLVRELADAGFESPYADRLRRRLNVAQAQQQLETEIVQEMAAALGRAGEKVDLAMLHLELAGREADRAESPLERRRRVVAFNQARAEALRARHELLIHREAIGIRSNRVLESMYPIPPKRH